MAIGSGCVLLYVRGAGVAASDGDGDVVEAASSMEEGDDSGIGEHAASGVSDSGDASEDYGGGGVPAAVVGCEAATGDGIRDRSPSRGLGDVYKRQGVLPRGRMTSHPAAA